MDCSLPGSSVHGIFQARVLERIAILGEDKTHVRSSVSLHGPRRMGRKPVMGPAGFWTLVRLEVTSLSLPCPPDCKPALLGGKVRGELCSLELKRCAQCTWPLLWLVGSPRKLSRAPGPGLLGWGGVPWHHLPLVSIQAWDDASAVPSLMAHDACLCGGASAGLEAGGQGRPSAPPGPPAWLPQSPKVGGWRKSSRHHRSACWLHSDPWWFLGAITGRPQRPFMGSLVPA